MYLAAQGCKAGKEGTRSRYIHGMHGGNPPQLQTGLSERQSQKNYASRSDDQEGHPMQKTSRAGQTEKESLSAPGQQTSLDTPPAKELYIFPPSFDKLLLPF